MNKSPKFFPKIVACMAVIGLSSMCQPAAATLFSQHNLVTDDQSANTADVTDPNLKNAWGMSSSPSSPFWISDNGTGLSTLYRVTPQNDTVTKVGLEVSIPGDGSVTGQVFNSAGAGHFNGDNFLFVSEDGTVSGWRGALGTSAETLVTGSADNVYKGTAFATIGGNSYLYAANFHTGNIDVVKGNAAAPNLPGNFTDPNLPAGFAPFNVQHLGDALYVTYAKQGAGKDDEKGLGNGFVNKFDLQGNLIKRIASQGALNSPWGLALAPSTFAEFANALLVGNFGDGRINAFDPTTAAFLGQLQGISGNPLEIDGLWGLSVGNNGNGGSPDRLYFTAGPNDEANGLFGVLQAQVPELTTFPLLSAALLSYVITRKRAVSRLA